MTDSNLTPTPSDPPMTLTPLLTEAGFSICGKFGADLADLCNAAGVAGMTPNMIAGQLWNTAMLLGFQVKEQVDAPAPAPVTDPPQSGPIASGPSDPGMGAPPAPPAALTTGGVVTLTVGTLTTPPSDMQVLALALGPYSLELRYSAANGLTYSAVGLWPGVTLYGAAGDLMRLTVEDTTVAAAISQDRGVTWTSFFTFQRVETGTLQPQVTATEYAGAAQLVVTP